MKKTILILILLLILPLISNAIEIQGKFYEEVIEDVVAKSFNMCNCIKEARKFYPEKNTKELKQTCWDAYVEFLMKKSEACDCVVVGVNISNICEED